MIKYKIRKPQGTSVVPLLSSPLLHQTLSRCATDDFERPSSVIQAPAARAHKLPSMAGDEAPTTEAACQDLVEILDEGSGRLDMGRYVDHVRDLSAGAIATFEGTTRDHFDGRRVVELRYEAYGSMARRRLEAILREARAAHALCRLAVAHRLGTVPAGEASVFVAASAVHRADAMDACRYVIDEIKASVPIWKKEVYDDGEVWKENREFLDRTDADKKGRPAGHGGSGGGCCGSKVRVSS
ncbi:molybdopterin synthase catalytic subunit-like [Hordeum vulgare subsp. vulgare]|uniref:Molybdopterin synthase catalytic subunit n=2 Tax=Hordeum vulgare subsp. vulgare TaxID=112509 RepID=A0A8I6Y0Z6_HORVV|nr:molybdopterin synthase catalytic subunit-like [Hordeum vulgare subsp. vulgare]